ncbi:MAG TPA: hypothetical protein ENO23_00775, partial [Alphaproteobacteria bacterium]|nr:hypothetical protein [Alphaproteobacteria bacterium]
YRLLLRARAYRGIGDAARAASACDDVLETARVPAPWLETMLLDIVAAVAPGEWDRFAARLPEAVPSARALASVAALLLERGEIAAAEPLIRRCATAPSPAPEEESLDGFLTEGTPARFELGTLDALVGILAAAGKKPDALSAGRAAGRRFGAAGRLVEARALEKTGSPRKAKRIYRRLYHSRESVRVKRDALYRMAVISLEAGDDDAAELYRTFGMYYPGDSRSAGALDTAARIEIARGRPERAITIFSELRRRGGALISREAALAESVLLVRAGNTREAKAILGAMLAGGDRRLEAWALCWLFRLSEGGEAERWRTRLLDGYPASACARFLRGGAAAFIVPERQRDPRAVVSALAGAERAAFELLATGATASPALQADPRYGAWHYALETGLLELGSAIGDLMLDFHGADERARLAIYREAREAGLLRIALRAIIGVPADRPGRHAATMPVAYERWLSGVAAERRLPPALLLAVMREESLFDRSAISRAGARGLMQLMPAT